jgi:hypothetical protein
VELPVLTFLFIGLVVSIIGLVLVINIFRNRLRSNVRKNLLGFIVLTILNLIFLTFSFAMYQISSPYHSVFRMANWLAGTEALYFLNRFSRFIIDLETNKAHKIRVFLSFVILPIMIMLPWNDWYYLNRFEVGHFTIQPFTVLYILILSTYIFYRAIKRTAIARKKILDPILSELYKWIQYSIMSIGVGIIALFGMFLYCISPLQYLPILNIITLILFTMGTIGMLFGIFGFYVTLTIPKRLLRKFYQKYVPMWNKNKSNSADDEINVDEVLNKLKKTLF